MRARPFSQQWHWVLLSVAMFWTFLQTAWVCEDAFITLRTVDFALQGHGLVWNVGERVQAYTHPLWLMILTPWKLVIGDPYVALITLSLCCSMGTLLAIKKTHQEWSLHSIAGITSILWSRAFIDYSSSGLENPLTHLLLAFFFLLWLRADSPHKGLWLMMLCSALYMNRPDSVVLIAPALAWQFWTARKLGQALLGALPAFAWTLFSLVYYGSSVPNTALSKVATGLPLWDRAGQAGQYFLWALENDPLTPVILVVGTLSGLTHPRLRPFSIGLLGWPLYLIYVGGDYMGGRFLSAATLLSAMLIAHAATPRTVWALLASLALGAGMLQYTVLSSPSFQNRYINEAGVSDERGFYYPDLGLMPVLLQGSWQTHPWFEQGAAARKQPGVYTRCAIGMSGYMAGPNAYIIDPLALTDPFLARLPSRTNVRVGHYERAFPPGYLASRLTSRNALEHPALRQLYDDVTLTTQGRDLWEPARLKAIWRLNNGTHQAAVAAHDREAIGLPGLPPKTNHPLSCYGIPYGWDGFYRLQGPPVTATNVLNTRR